MLLKDGKVTLVNEKKLHCIAGQLANKVKISIAEKLFGLQ